MNLGVAFPSISGEVDGMDEVQQLASIVLRPWVASSSFSFLLFLFLSSSPSFFLSFLSLFSIFLDVVNENEGGREVRWLVERVYMWV